MNILKKVCSLLLALALFIAPVLGASSSPLKSVAEPKATIDSNTLPKWPTLDKILTNTEYDAKAPKTPTPTNGTFGLKRSTQIEDLKTESATTSTAQEDNPFAGASAQGSTGDSEGMGSTSSTTSLPVIVTSSPSNSNVSLSGLDTPSTSVESLSGLATPSIEERKLPEGSFLYELLNHTRQLPLTPDEKNTQNIHPLPFDDFKTTAKLFFKTMQQCMGDDRLWINKKPAEIFCKSISNADKSSFCPFVQKITINSNQKVRHIGDIHGDINQLVDILIAMFYQYQMSADLKLADDWYILFHGDLVDRGWYSTEVVWLAMCLKIANPNHVFILRGNHEDWWLNAQVATGGMAKEFYWKWYTKRAKDELKQAYIPLKNESKKAYTKRITEETATINKQYETLFTAIYNLLPVSIIVNNDILCCHGSPDWAYNPAKLQATDMPEAFERLTHDNYNPAWIIAQMDKKVLLTLACDISECNVNNPETLVSETMNELDEFMRSIITDHTRILKDIHRTVKKDWLAQQTQVEGETKTAKIALPSSYNTAENELFNTLKQCSELGKEVHDYATQQHAVMQARVVLNYYNRITETVKKLKQYTEATLGAADNIIKSEVATKTQIVNDCNTIVYPKYQGKLKEMYDAWVVPIYTIARVQTALVELMHNPDPTGRQAIFDKCKIKPEEHQAIFGPNGVFNLLFLNYVDATTPLKPEDILFLNGDLIVGSTRTFLCETTPTNKERFGQERLAFGKDIMHEIMRLQHFRCAIRGHQQFETMRKPLDDNKGIAPLWDSKTNFANTKAHQLEDGCIYTLDVAYVPFASQLAYRRYNNSAVVTYGPSFETCTMQNNIQYFDNTDDDDSDEDDDSEAQTPVALPTIHEDPVTPTEATPAATDETKTSIEA